MGSIPSEAQSGGDTRAMKSVAWASRPKNAVTALRWITLALAFR
jgi:hypothetical protein